ncbi:MAG: glycosyltransferase, partial [Kiritimatiellae bacterium]|nr:glycosyltransferase [Kiritimatiellia bacterium]
MGAHNAARYLREALGSLLAQTFQDFECVVVDDASTDETPKILAEFARYDQRIRTVRCERKQGVAASLNRAIETARGVFFARMDADDISMVERFEKQVAFLEDHPECVIVGGQVDFIDEDGDFLCEFKVPLTHEEIEQRLWRGDSLALVHPCVMMRAASVRRAGCHQV